MNNERIYYSHDAEVHEMRVRTVITLVFLTFGLGIGALLALLFAPASGKTTRHEIVKTVEEGMRTGRETVEPIVKQAGKDLADMRKNVEEHLKPS
jgi:gas vesicle protein